MPESDAWLRNRLLRGLAAAVAAITLALVPVVPADAADAVTETVLTVEGTPEPDGTAVTLDVTLLTTDASKARPAIVLAHGFGGTKDDSLETARTLARDGYAVITYTARGFGTSGGQIHLDNPAYEGADARRLIDLAAIRPEIQSTGGDPVIGFAGGSYGGAISLIVAGLDPRVDAIAPAFTWNSLSQALFPQYASATAPTSLAGLDGIDTTGVFKQRWASLFFLGGGASPGGPSGESGASGGGESTGDDAGLCGRFTAALCRGYLATAESGRPDPDLVALLDESTPDLSAITAPTLIVQGEDDTLFPLDHADGNLRGLPADTPARTVWVTGGHDTAIDLDALVPELESWFGRYLKKDGSTPDTGFTVTVPETSLVGSDGGGEDDPVTLSTPAYPGRGAPLDTRTVPLDGEAQTMISPPGGTPAAWSNLPGTGGVLRSLASVGGYALGVLPGQSATFTTAPVAEPVVLVGSGSVPLRVTASESTATLFVSVWDLGPDTTPGVPGTAVLPGLGVAPVRLTGLTSRTPQDVIVTLPPVAHQVPVGHRMQVVVSSTDQAYAVPSKSVVYGVDLVGDRALLLPVLDATPSSAGLDVPLPLVIVVSALVLAAIAALVLLGVRRRSTHPRAELLGVPLVVEDLVKTYGDGFKAVDGVSFRAEAGQVVGLLGPNGAGKTTTMRMLVGLIRPDAGTVYVEGQPVHAGADVLGSVGAFIEGPGFLPHLTGSENLDAYWQATGRPPAEAHLDEALEIAGLGAALDRKVRGYSQGMRQRLGIAQAMLGLPSLLLLDEPTNGLDPPQIRAMRQVLADYAAGGRTVVVSSHLLSEVEQTCSHVVVMHRGKVILTGSMEALTATDDVTLIGLGRRGDLAAARANLEGLGVSTVTEHGLIRVTGNLPRATLVASLVDGGHPVESVDGRRQLEEVFMSLVGTSESGNPGPGAPGPGASA